LELGANASFPAQYKCHMGPMESLEISLVAPKGKAWIGTSDLYKVKQNSSSVFATTIAKVVRPKRVYFGSGGYGKYGGYDITLVLFDKDVPAQFGMPACLPKTTLVDEGIKGELRSWKD
jgi:hypothetical protein